MALETIAVFQSANRHKGKQTRLKNEQQASLQQLPENQIVFSNRKIKSLHTTYVHVKMKLYDISKRYSIQISFCSIYSTRIAHMV